MRRSIAILLITSVSAAGADLPANSGVVPRQMPDGSKVFVYSTQWPPKIQSANPETLEAVLIDMIAQSLARAQWCSNGWDITNRFEMKGSLAIEGRCK